MHLTKTLPLSFLSAALLLVGCGPSGKAGEACDKSGFLCQDTATALECRGNVWVALPCKGPGGCAVSGGNVQCDMNGNAAGDACASTAEGKGLCSADKKATLECRSGALVQTNVCQSCSTTADQVVCN
jgi:hypothetical protein